jgi:uncharacterized membrane protein YbhN (UPF0104 family)
MTTPEPATNLHHASGIWSLVHAVSAVLMFRLATFWLPVAPGWLCWRVLQRREYV